MLATMKSPNVLRGSLIAGAIAAAFVIGGCGHEHHDDDYRASQSGYYDHGVWHDRSYQDNNRYDNRYHDYDHDHDRDRY